MSRHYYDELNGEEMDLTFALDVVLTEAERALEVVDDQELETIDTALNMIGDCVGDVIKKLKAEGKR